MQEIHGDSPPRCVSQSNDESSLSADVVIRRIVFQLQCSHHVNNWGVEVLLGVFDMVELLVDLIAARLSYSPVPVQLLETLAILFDHDSVFHRKHRSKAYDRSLYDKQLGERVLAHSPSSTYKVYDRNEPYGWLCQIINRFVLKDGVENLKKQFQAEQPLNAVVSIEMPLFVCPSSMVSARNITRFSHRLATVWTT